VESRIGELHLERSPTPTRQLVALPVTTILEKRGDPPAHHILLYLRGT